MNEAKALRTAVVNALKGANIFENFPERPPDQINEFPFPVIYNNNVSWKWGTAHRGGTRGAVAGKMGQVTVFVEIHIPVALPTIDEGFLILEQYEDLVPDTLMSIWRDQDSELHQVALSLKEIRGKVQDLGYGDEDTFGWRWELDFELEGDVT